MIVSNTPFGGTILRSSVTIATCELDDVERQLCLTGGYMNSSSGIYSAVVISKTNVKLSAISVDVNMNYTDSTTINVYAR